MDRKKIVVLGGDGVGPEVTRATVAVMRAVSDDLDFVDADIGMSSFEQREEYLPRETLDKIDRADAILFGAVTHPESDKTYRNPIVTLRKQLELYADVRHIFTIAPGLGAPDIDLILVRDNDEGSSNLKESEDLDGVTTTERIELLEFNRVCKIARRVAEEHKRKKITCVHRQDLYKKSGELVLKTFYDSMEGSKITANDEMIDEAIISLIRRPGDYDVMLGTTFHSDIIFNIMSTMAGGRHVMPSGSIGDKTCIFEPMHGALMELAGKNIVNPVSSILSGYMLLKTIGMEKEGLKIKNSVQKVLAQGGMTADLGGNLNTTEFTERVVKLCSR